MKVSQDFRDEVDEGFACAQGDLLPEGLFALQQKGVDFIDPETAFGRIDHYFGSLPGGEPIPNTPQIVIMNSPAGWGRPLTQSTTALIPFLGDAAPVLNADF